MDDLGIQSFVPKVGDNATDVEGIEVVGTTSLVEGSKPNGVSEIVSQGFIMNFQDGRKEILKTAQVNVYK